jgi:hypothetical protein
METGLKNNIDINLPVKIGYDVLEKVLRKRMVGETFQIEKENGEVTKYAEVLNVRLGKSLEDGYDLTAELEFKTLTALFKNKTAGILFHAVIEFNERDQQVEVGDFKIKGTSSSWLMNKSLETVANKIVYGKLKNKMKMDFRPHLEPELQKLNAKLENSMQAGEGVYLSGKIGEVRICEFIAGNTEIYLVLKIQGGTAVEIRDIKFKLIIFRDKKRDLTFKVRSLFLKQIRWLIVCFVFHFVLFRHFLTYVLEFTVHLIMFISHSFMVTHYFIMIFSHCRDLRLHLSSSKITKVTS